ncbi:Zinc finger MYM-type protein 6 [Araneus ventricosus]|uniref:Zinc finger MYM-type protein 6 n=1 Tax=Araneus ventricosus TaxID=182803 RepID=A0A4Y2S2R1_ARAVE|nr:Zinc finger MYM-type protein 6 [Araneus ventricosus]
MDKWLKTGTLMRAASRIEIRITDSAAMEITVDQQDDNHEVQRTTVWPVQADSTNTRLFRSLCEDMGSLHTTLLLHTEVRWLSRGNVLTRLFELRHEVEMFSEDHPFTLSSKFYESECLQQLAYLSDIFSYINKLNLGLQNDSIRKVTDKIEFMIKKLNFW